MGTSLSVASVERTRDAILLALHTRFKDTTAIGTPLSVLALDAFQRIDRAQREWIASSRLDDVLRTLGLAGRWDRGDVDAFAYCFTVEEDDELEAARTSRRLDYLAFLRVLFFPIHVPHDQTPTLTITQQAVVAVGGWLVHDGEIAGRRVAVKEVRVDHATDSTTTNNERDDAIAQLRRRINALRLVAHPNLVRYITTVETHAALYVVERWHASCTLRTILESFGPMKEATIRRYVVQILAALRCLHGHDLFHGNLHLESIHIDSSGLLKLSDFGASSEFRLLGVGGDTSLQYPPPELVRTKAADVWSVGILMLQMAQGVTKQDGLGNATASYGARKYPQTATAPANLELPAIPTTMSKSVRSIVQACLQRRVRARPTIEQLCSNEFFHVDPAKATSELLRDVCIDLDESMQRLTASSRSPTVASRAGARGASTRQSVPQMRSTSSAERPLFTTKQRL